MKEDEDIATNVLRVDEIVNEIKGLGEEVVEYMIVKKALRYLPLIFDPNISTLEEREYMSAVSVDELHGIFAAYEMRTKQENPSKKEANFKASKKRKKKKNPESKSNCNYSNHSEEDEEISNFARKLKRGTNKYKGILPLKCFNCGKIGHFANKCPYAKKSDSNKEEDPKKENKYQKGNMKCDKRKVFKKNMYSREDSSTYDEYNESDNDSKKGTLYGYGN
jgi:hypothetical protein